MNAVRGADVACCVQIIQQGFAWINEKAQNGCTALHYAAQKGLATVIFALLSSPEFVEESAIAVVDGVSWKALELAVASGHNKMAAAMNSYIAPEDGEAGTSSLRQHSSWEQHASSLSSGSSSWDSSWRPSSGGWGKHDSSGGSSRWHDF